jgi:hypothetical protein
MAPQTVEEIIHALQEHPEWREPLLNALLTDQYRQLPIYAHSPKRCGTCYVGLTLNLAA